MIYMRIARGAEITVINRRGLLGAWKQYGALVSRFILEGEITASQRNKLPKALRERLVIRLKSAA
jgi:hypothetical protein